MTHHVSSMLETYPKDLVVLDHENALGDAQRVRQTRGQERRGRVLRRRGRPWRKPRLTPRGGKADGPADAGQSALVNVVSRARRR